jgi:ribosomal-protein-alanine N-acetyltransferase
VKEEAELIDFVISPSRRQQGLGLILLQGSLQRLRADSVARCHLEVRHSNFAAIGLYHKVGFVIVGQRPNYYRGQEEAEDAILMRWQANDGSVPP